MKVDDFLDLESDLFEGYNQKSLYSNNKSKYEDNIQKTSNLDKTKKIKENRI